jgi:hypothetical protein
VERTLKCQDLEPVAMGLTHTICRIATQIRIRHLQMVQQFKWIPPIIMQQAVMVGTVLKQQGIGQNCSDDSRGTVSGCYGP